MKHLAPLLALLAAPFIARGVDMAVVFNEVHYHPAGAETEWIELHNLHGVDVDLSGWEVDGGVNYKFAEGAVIPGHGFLLLAAVPLGLPGSLGPPWTGSLGNAGETIRLRNRDGRTMAEVSYADNGDWPVGPDGTGTTLARRKPGAHDGPSAWAASNELGGTPGGANFASSPPIDTSPSLVFNLLRSATDAAANPSDAIVIRNAGTVTVNYTGLEIRNGSTVLYTLPEGSLTQGSTLPVPLSSLPGYARGMELALVAGGTKLLDARRVDGVSRERYTAADGSIEWAELPAHTSAIVINEIFYDGPGESKEQWVELHNKSGADVNIGGWRFSDGIDFTFGPATALPAGGYLVVAWDVLAFQVLHPGVSNVTGPFGDSIDRGGERLRLVDATGNIADEVRFFPGEKGSPLGAGGQWPKWAGGGGASLELTDPNSDNTFAGGAGRAAGNGTVP